MRALTLTQPWASLVEFGEKSVETRSWSTNHRGPLAIHAAQGLAGHSERELAHLCDREPFSSALLPHIDGYSTYERWGNLPRGALVGFVELEHVLPTDHLVDDLQDIGYNVPHVLSPTELAFGDYSAGRFAWMLRHRIRLYDAIPCRGYQGLWNVPADVLPADVTHHFEAVET